MAPPLLTYHATSQSFLITLATTQQRWTRHSPMQDEASTAQFIISIYALVLSSTSWIRFSSRSARQWLSGNVAKWTLFSKCFRTTKVCGNPAMAYRAPCPVFCRREAYPSFERFWWMLHTLSSTRTHANTRLYGTSDGLLEPVFCWAQVF